jgi:hypothetical protein
MLYHYGLHPIRRLKIQARIKMDSGFKTDSTYKIAINLREFLYSH